MKIKTRWNNNHKEKIKKLFPQIIGASTSGVFEEFGLKVLNVISNNSKSAWVPCSPSDLTAETLSKLEKNFGNFPDEGVEPRKVIRLITKNFFLGVPNWRSPELQYNICAPVNCAAAALLSLAQEVNIHNISSDYAGRCLSAENAVLRIMASLVDLSPDDVKGFFTFGGTGSNMYAMKLGINNAVPTAGKTGVPQNIYFLLTSDAHFSHKTVADWLGVGVDRAIVIKADKEGRSMVDDAELKAREIINKGGIIGGFMLNGGPFYNFVVDDVRAFVDLREKLIKDYNLTYTPHIHVDTVIGWIWLMFNGYDFNKNPLRIPAEALVMIKKQFERVYQIRLADSWGVDFHKALGGCPTPCGLFVCNHKQELRLLSKSHRGIDTHQLGNDWSLEDASDMTLETSRAAGSALAALASLFTMGRNGFRSYLANQMVATVLFRDGISRTNQFVVGNPFALGFNTMVVLTPTGVPSEIKNWEGFLSAVEDNKELLANHNKMVKNFYEWCLSCPDKNGERLGCSFSRSFKKTISGDAISALKYCFVSPHMDDKVVNKEIKKLQKQFKEFCNQVPNLKF